MSTFRHMVLIVGLAGLLAGCAGTGGEQAESGEVKFRLSDGVVRIIEQEGGIDLAADSRVGCIEDRVTGSQRLLRICATRRELQSAAWRSQFGNIASVQNLTDLQNYPSALIQ